MTTIRERVAAPMRVPAETLSLLGTLQEAMFDRRALLDAGDALAATVKAQHPVSPVEGFGGVVIDTWCEGCDAPERECWAVKAIDRWAEVTGPQR